MPEVLRQERWHSFAAADASVNALAQLVLRETFRQIELLHWWSHCYVAACRAHLGLIEEGQRAVAEVLRLKPDFSMQDVKRSEYWREPADIEHAKDGLRKVGLPG